MLFDKLGVIYMSDVFSNIIFVDPNDKKFVDAVKKMGYERTREISRLRSIEKTNELTF